MKSMKNIFSNKDSKKKDDSSVASSQKGDYKTDRNKKVGSKNDQQRPAQKPKGTTGHPAPKSAKKAQSALLPGNKSGLVKQKEHPMIQFGPILKEFLASKELVDKSVHFEYHQVHDEYKIAVSFKTVLANGVSTSKEVSLSIEEYLSQRKTLLKVKDESSHYQGFLTKLIDRVGLDLTAAKPNVTFKSVEVFVMKHLSPVERGIMHLTGEEYDRIDTRKIAGIMKPSMAIIDSHYGSFRLRTEYLVKQINSVEGTADKEPPNWVLGGVTALSKGVLLDALKLQQVPKVTEEQKALIELLSSNLFGDSDESKSVSGHPTADTNDSSG